MQISIRTGLINWRDWHADIATQLAIAHALVGVPALILAIDSAVRWMRLPVPLAGQAAVAVLIYATMLWLRPLETGAISRPVVALIAVLLGASWMVASALYDVSWDGTSYHLPGLLKIYDGWNPIFAASGIEPLDLQANGLWTARAAFYAVSPIGVEAVKALNVLFCLAALLTIVPAWTLLRGQALTPIELALLYVAVGNPVALGQLFTFYVDGTLYACGLVLVGGVLLASSPYRRIALDLIVAAIVLVTGAKLAGIYYAVVLSLLAALAVARRIRNLVRVGALVIAALVVSVVAIGFRPYMTNPRDYGQLVVLGPTDSLGRPPAFAESSPPEMLFASVFARTDVAPVVRLKIPITITLSEIKSMGAPDTRVGGFGPLFALEVLVALLVTGFAVLRKGGHGLGDTAFILALGLTVSAAAFPEPWCARYVPFFWAVPIMLVLGVDLRWKLARLSAVLILVLATINGGLALAANLARTAVGNHQLRALFRELAAERTEILLVPIPNRGWDITAAHRLASVHIPFRVGTPEVPQGDTSPQCARVIRNDRLRYCIPATAADK
jgi:hypothetical protein